MRNIKLTLTPSQAGEIIYALEMDINPNFNSHEPSNRFIQRIIKKIDKACEEAWKDKK